MATGPRSPSASDAPCRGRFGRFLGIAAEGVRSALRHPVRSILTATTSAVAIAVTVNVISLVYGLEEDVRRDSGRFGRRTVDVVRVPRIRPGGGRDALGEAEIAIIESRLAPLEALIVPRRMTSCRVEAEAAADRVGVVAAPPAYLATIDVPMAAGRWLETGDATGDACVLDAAVAAALFPTEGAAASVGRTITVRRGETREDRRVVGVLSDPMTHRALFEAFDSARGARMLASMMLSFRNVYVPLEALPGDEYSGIAVLAKSDAAVDEIGARLRTIWPADPEIPFLPKGSVGVFVRREWMDMVGQQGSTGAFLSNLIWMIIVGVAIVMLATLELLTIRERYDELAIRRVEGARKGDVALQITAEGVLLSLLGGLAGLPLGYLGASLLRTIVAFPFRFELRYALVATGIAVVLGLVASALPARHAASLQPVRVLSRRRT